jgi:hypothetical protein
MGGFGAHATSLGSGAIGAAGLTGNRPERTLARFGLGAGHDPLLPLRFEKSCRPTFEFSGARLFARPLERFVSCLFARTDLAGWISHS